MITSVGGTNLALQSSDKKKTNVSLVGKKDIIRKDSGQDSDVSMKS